MALLFAGVSLLLSCTCGVPLRVTSVQRSDKKLTCKDVILEINESEEYRKQGAIEKGIGFGEILAPLCWVNGYLDGRSAVGSANARIEYLGHIYDLLDCGGKGKDKDQQQPPAMLPPPPPPPAPVVVPAPKPARVYQPVPNTNLHFFPMEEATNKYYRLIDKKTGLHEHKDKNGKIYIHNHAGGLEPHVHLEDQ